ncbi:OmpA family protein [Solitalea koreensis]|uniref:Outer membrane protein OmpA n=1 Tax=Solitalea koreensis TaxID=543615 RepID=A0A521BLK4_9SPHI|nr:OmpA family protein [Solitalea koreensis]SMO47993.1 Outer membrane protein OmpA [Solitalea koreensis]
MQRFCLVLLFCLYSTLSVFGQVKLSSQSKKAIEYYNKSDEYLSVKNYKEGSAILEKAVKEDPNFIDAFQRLGDIYRITKDTANAKKNYQRVILLNPDFQKQDYFFLGDIEISNGNYISARQYLEKFMSYEDKAQKYIPDAKRLLADCKFADTALKTPVAFNPKNLGDKINTSADEYFPTITADGATLIFTRRTVNNEDFYFSNLVDGKWSLTTPLKGNINTPNCNEGACNVYADGQLLLFTICNSPNGLGRCDIYFAKLEGSKWSKPFNLGPPINTTNWESQACLAPNGRTLYFVSERKGGLGKNDIWKAELQDDGSWTAPENLGPNINTPFNDESPFLHADDQTLYFSSEGWPGMGAHDIFISRKDNAGNWGKPQNIGYPINTFREEISLVTDGSGNKGYFSSNTLSGHGGYDLYNFDLPESIKPAKLTFVKGIVFDKNDKLKLDARVEVINLKTGTSIYKSLSNAETGNFFASLPLGNEYVLNVSKKGYLFYSDHFTIPGNDTSRVFTIEAPLSPIAVGEKVVLKNIFFETNSFQLNPSSKIELNKLIDFMKSNPTVNIEISGHTDNIGGIQPNQLLSENRAKTVYGYIIKAFPYPNRLSYKGYGETQPIDNNGTEKGRANNRRTEFKVTKIE